jgi:16S rRNA (guanine527-N7)-methyltransferase
MTQDGPEQASGPQKGPQEGVPASSPAGAAGAGDTPRGAARKAPEKKEPPDPDAELLYADQDVPDRTALEEAMTWAFEGEVIPPELLGRFVDHALMVLEGNRRMNLTAITDPREVAAKHYLDSWRVVRLWPVMGRSVLDLGTGAGFPGIPVALGEPMARVTLIDSTKKRVDFVQRCIEKLGLSNATAVWGRAEEYLARNDFDMVLMRGLSSVRENVRLLRKVRHSHKDLVLYKGPSWSREMRAAEREAERLGFRLDTVLEHELPDGLGKRAILVYRAPGGAGM